MANLEKRRILVIDDDVNIFYLIKTLLGEAYEYDNALTVNEGIEKTKKFLPNLVFLDICVGNELGFSYLQWKRKEQSTYHYLKVIVISSDGFAKNVKTAIGLGGDDFVVKPLVNKVILAKTKKAFLKSTAYAKMLTKEEDQKATAYLSAQVVGTSDTAIYVEAPMRPQNDNYISIGQKKYEQRGNVSRGNVGSSKFMLYEIGDDVDSRQSYSDKRTDSIEEKFTDASFTVYVLDDDVSMHSLLAKFFEKLAVQVSCFADIKNFEKTFHNKVPSLCILDLSINSENDSFDLIEKLSKEKDV